MTIKAALFDLDGTLLDTLTDLAEAMNRVLQQHGFPQHPVDAYKHFVGDGMDMLVRRVLPESIRKGHPRDCDRVVADCLAGMKTSYHKAWDIKTRPYDGIPEMLSALSKLGLKLAIYSNKPHEFTVEMVSHYFPDLRFTHVLGARIGWDRKPSPDVPLAISHELGISPGEWIYLGDTSMDMNAGNSAGMHTIGVLWGFRERSELEGAGAKTIISHPSEVTALLERF